jgi:hypothetical protein
MVSALDVCDLLTEALEHARIVVTIGMTRSPDLSFLK